jgi:hypothetical protein
LSHPDSVGEAVRRAFLQKEKDRDHRLSMERLRAARIRTISCPSAGLIMLRLSYIRTIVVGAVRSTRPFNETEKRSAARCSRLHSEPQHVRSLSRHSVTASRSSLSDRRESPTRNSLVTSHAGDSIRMSIHRLRLRVVTRRPKGIEVSLDI